MENITFSINNRVKDLIKAKHVTISYVAEQLGMKQQNLSIMLNSDDLKVSTVFKIAKILDVPISTFFEEMDRDLPPAPQKLDAIYEKINELLTIAKHSQKGVFAV